MKIDIKMMNFDAAKNTVTGIVDVNNTTITVSKFDLQTGASATQAVRDYKALDVKWVNNIHNKQLDISGDTHE